MRLVFYSDILERKIVRGIQEDTSINENCALLYKRIDRGYNETLKFVRECAITPQTCTQYIRELCDIKNKYPNDSTINNIWNTSILPKLFVESLPITEDVNSTLQIKKNKVCDRIIDNHNHIQESYNISSFVKKFGNKHPEFCMNRICECVDKFKLPYHGKVVIALEEFYYTMEGNGFEYDNSIIGKIPIRYFKESENISLLEKSLVNSISIDYNDKWLNDTGGINDILFNLREDILSSKDESVITDEIDNSVNEIYCSIKELCEDTLYLSEKVLKNIYDSVKEFTVYNHKYQSPIYESTITSLSQRFGYCNTKMVNEVLRTIEEAQDILYPINNISYMSEYKHENIISLEEFKIFKFNNVLNVVGKIDKYLGNKLNNVKDKTLKRIKELKRKVFGESVYAMLDENGNMNYQFVSYEIVDGVDKSIHKFFNELCHKINNDVLLDNDIMLRSGYICYYEATENIVSLYITSDDRVAFKESEFEEWYNYISEDDMYMMQSLSAYSEIFDIVEKYPITEEKLSEYFYIHINDTDTVKAFIELCSYCIDHSIIENSFNKLESVLEAFVTLAIPYEYDFRTYYPQQSLPLEIKLEAYCEIVDILYEDVKPVDKKKQELKEKEQQQNKDKEESKEKKQPVEKEDINSDKVGGVNFTNVKLVLAGLKKKVKDLGSKEQAVSRNLDVTFNMFVKACKNALISDRREAIIKGSVIPSFSKCIKMGIGVAAIASVNVTAAVIAVIGGLAMSKRLTNKERALLLDDIEVEIEVLDKEISIAESKNQLKKLRVLMKTKKDLQRQYQRIKYGIRVGKDILPSSNLRTPGGDK